MGGGYEHGVTLARVILGCWGAHPREVAWGLIKRWTLFRPTTGPLLSGCRCLFQLCVRSRSRVLPTKRIEATAQGLRRQAPRSCLVIAWVTGGQAVKDKRQHNLGITLLL